MAMLVLIPRLRWLLSDGNEFSDKAVVWARPQFVAQGVKFSCSDCLRDPVYFLANPATSFLHCKCELLYSACM